jgi:putative membrane protein
MKNRHQAFVWAASALLFTTYVGAQTPSTQDPTSPGAASSPHQRDATGTAAPEATPQGQEDSSSTQPSAASTPHQREAMKSGNMEHRTSTPGSTGGQDPKTFVKKAALDGMTEVQLGKIAQEKSQNPDVRSFAERMVKDHTKANDELKTLAKRKGYDVPAKLDAEHEAMITKLGGKSGAVFDSAYAQAMDKDHAKALALFTDAQQSSDPDLAAFAQKTLPTLEQHKQLADALSPKTKTASSEANDKERAR